MPSSRLSCLLVAAGLAGVALAAPAMADPANTVSAEIQYDNNALNTHSGAVSVLESVKNQALDVCRYDAPISTAPRTDEACVGQVIAQAVTKIDHPELTAAYIARSNSAPRLVADNR